MRPAAFAASGRWYRGNLHTHSDRSDGMASVQQVIAAYRSAGYDFLVLTDHFEARWGWTVTDTSGARDRSFTTLLGAELSSADWNAEDVFWVNAIGLPPDFPPPSPDEPHAAIIRRAAEAGAYNVLLASRPHDFLDFDRRTVDHRQRSRPTTSTPRTRRPDRAEGRYAVDALLARGHRRHVTARGTTRIDRGEGSVPVLTLKFVPIGSIRWLRQALRAGAYYSSKARDRPCRCRRRPCARSLQFGEGCRAHRNNGGAQTSRRVTLRRPRPYWISRSSGRPIGASP